jgi:hypothetical protein
MCVLVCWRRCALLALLAAVAATQVHARCVSAICGPCACDFRSLFALGVVIFLWAGVLRR